MNTPIDKMPGTGTGTGTYTVCPAIVSIPINTKSALSIVKLTKRKVFFFIYNLQ